EYLRPAGAAKIKVTVVNADAEKNDFENTAPAFEPELEKLLKHHDIPSTVRSAATFSFTSCTRKISAPRIRKIALRAIVGASRSRISFEPISFPKNDLRETPTTRGRSCTRTRSRFFSSD